MKTPNNRMQSHRETREEVQRPIWPGNDVDFNPAICPNCGSARNHIEKTYPAIPISDGGSQRRLHACADCHTRFRSSQRIPLRDMKYCRCDEG